MIPAFTPPEPTEVTIIDSIKQMLVATVFTGVVPFNVIVSVYGPAPVASK
jgi:hypothetical protein